MGVPAFYRWLSEKYPKIVQDVLEERVGLASESGSIRVPFDATLPNPSGLETDNLYIDMNGIIHPCSHPENGPQPASEEEMYENVCRYVDRLFRVVRPRKLLYLAIDGVAPRAKMNQQRSRRFRSAQEARERAELEDKMRVELAQTQGIKADKGPAAWDSNIITPGTSFMLRLSEFIRFYVRKRVSTDPAWKNITVIFSDASVPGEGEHKIMNHVRHQRSQPGYDPNLVHVLHGLDADLIMLALATHEAHFYILREEVLFGRKSAEQSERRKEESGFSDAQRQFDEAVGVAAMEVEENKTKPLQRISIPILREYLANEFRQLEHVPFQEVSFERLVDDIVFLCFFVGNDFLPHLPSLDIRDGALDFLFNVYKRVLPTLGDYITNHGGEVNLSHADVILAEVAAIEDYVFSMKHENEENDKRRREQMNARNKARGGRNRDDPRGAVIQPPVPAPRMGKAARLLADKASVGVPGATAVALGKAPQGGIKYSAPVDENARVAMELKASLGGSSKVKDEEEETEWNGDDDVKGEKKRKRKDEEEEDVIEVEVVVQTQAEKDEASRVLKEILKKAEQEKLDNFAKNVEDKVRLHEAGWKDRYYRDKCKADDVENHGGREHLFRSYVMGLCWVMKYYYSGCPSWKWYYPFHYAPFASDLRNIERFSSECTSFELNEPFKPVEQLMAVLPEDSSHAIPKAARWIMADVESPIIDFYPKDVPCDPNGKAMPWLWVVLLPFIDEDRLLSALHPTMAKWTKEELLGNAKGLDDGYIFIHSSHPLIQKVSEVLKAGDEGKTTKFALDPPKEGPCSGFTGKIRQPLSNEIFPADDTSVVHPPPSASRITFQSHDCLFSDPVDPNSALCAAFTEPDIKKHLSVMLMGAIPVRPCLNDEDRRIRRPRLNRGGGTIANMGGMNSHQAGYGSMNISSHERDLAHRTGRGHQMNQTGTRAWGAMEPTPKYQRTNNGGRGNAGHQGGYNPQYGQNSFQNGGRGQPGFNRQQGNSAPYQNQHTRFQSAPPPPPPPPPPRQYQQGRQQPGGYQQQYPPQNQHTRFQAPPPPPPRQGFSFRGQGQNNPQPNTGHAFNRNNGRPNQQGAPANSSLISSLRSQLANTLQKNKDRK